MRRPAAPVLAVLWAAGCGAVLGALRTRDAALHLLAKNGALEAAGIPSLPGPGRFAEMASSAPAAAGALFFGLSLGAGVGALLAAWAAFGRSLPGRIGRWAPWAGLLIALPPLFAGDPGLAGVLLACAAGAAAAAPLGSSGRPRSTALCTAIVCLGLLPWATAPEGAFTRLRDRFLLSPGAGLALDRFYYRWTLYPAEVLKNLSAVSQPVAAPAEGNVAPASFCAQATALRVLCVDRPCPGADFRLESGPAGTVLVGARARAPWPAGPSPRERGQAWRAFAREEDRSGPLRVATAWSLFAGCPLALLWALGSGCTALAGRAPHWSAAALAAVLAAALAWTSRVDPELARAQGARGTARAGLTQVQAWLGSPRPVLRLYGARAARDVGPGASPTLVRALSDPVVNVRYAAAESLGYTGGSEAREALLRTLTGPDEWYVKERAYAALWRLGWRPRNA